MTATNSFHHEDTKKEMQKYLIDHSFNGKPKATASTGLLDLKVSNRK